MQDINLIPQTSKVNQEVENKTNSLGSLLKLLIVILVISSLTAASIYGIIYYRLREVKTQHDQLKTELENLKKSEQRFILLRDRLQKISKIQAQFGTDEEIATAKDLIENVTSPSVISTMTLTPDSVETEIATDSSLNVTKLFSYLVGSGKYSRITMLSFDYSPDLAYRVNLEIIK